MFCVSHNTIKKRKQSKVKWSDEEPSDEEVLVDVGGAPTSLDQFDELPVPDPIDLVETGDLVWI